MAKAAMKILAEHGTLRAGMEVEPVPDIMPTDAQRRLTDFRAVILNPNGGPDSIQWRGGIQSLSQMLEVLEREHGARGLYGVHRNFRIVGHDSSLRKEAEILSQTEVIDDPVNPPEGQKKGAERPPGEPTPPVRSPHADILRWLRENIEKVAIPVIIAVLTAAVLALLGLSK